MRITEDEISLQIIDRFFQAIELLRQYRIIRGLQTFTRNHGLNRWNINVMKKDRSHNYFRASWITFLYQDYKVSPIWMLTGEGGFFLEGFDAEKVKKLRITCKSKSDVSVKSENQAVTAGEDTPGKRVNA